MDIYEFMSSSHWLTFFLAVGVCCIVEILFFRLPNRVMRHANIRKWGYPPAHCDADGDFLVKDEGEK